MFVKYSFSPLVKLCEIFCLLSRRICVFRVHVTFGFLTLVYLEVVFLGFRLNFIRNFAVQSHRAAERMMDFTRKFLNMTKKQVSFALSGPLWGLGPDRNYRLPPSLSTALDPQPTKKFLQPKLALRFSDFQNFGNFCSVLIKLWPKESIF
jgi:hypothetical protein